MTAVSIGLLVAGGVGMISTYQTGLVLAALTIVYATTLAEDRTRRSGPDSDPDVVLARAGEPSLSGAPAR